MKFRSARFGPKKITVFIHENKEIGRAVYSFDGMEMYLDHIHVDDNIQRQGLGTEAMRYLKKQSNSIIAQIRKLDEKTLNYYRKNGFVINGRMAYWVR